MKYRDPVWLRNKLMDVLRTGNPNEVRDFLESIAIEAVNAHKAGTDKIMVDAVVQGILQERVRCLDIVNNNLGDGDAKTTITALIKDENPND